MWIFIIFCICSIFKCSRTPEVLASVFGLDWRILNEIGERDKNAAKKTLSIQIFFLKGNKIIFWRT